MFGYSENVFQLEDQVDGAAYLTEDGCPSPHTSDIISNLMMAWSTANVACASYPNDPCSDQSTLTPSPQPITPPTPTSSIQATRSYLIKEGLKLTIQTKRQAQGLNQIKPEFNVIGGEDLTVEDEERRSRRRERNKVAATKCRNKKKERTQRLAKESEGLEASNHALKQEIHELQQEKQQLIDLLSNHRPICVLSAPCNSRAQAQIVI